MENITALEKTIKVQECIITRLRAKNDDLERIIKDKNYLSYVKDCDEDDNEIKYCSGFWMANN